MHTAQLFFHRLLQGEEITSSKEDQRGLAGFTATWVAKAGLQTPWWEGDSPSRPNHTVKLQHEEAGLRRALWAQDHCSPAGGSKGSSEAGHDAGQGISRLSDKNGPPISNQSVFFPLYFEVVGRVRKGIPIRRKAFAEKSLSCFDQAPMPRRYAQAGSGRRSGSGRAACILHFLCTSSSWLC